MSCARAGSSRSTWPCARPPQAGKDDVRNLSGAHPFDGARVANILPGVADELGIEEQEGVVILSVRPASTAAGIGFQPGDVILQVGREKIETVSELEAALKERQRCGRSSSSAATRPCGCSWRAERASVAQHAATVIVQADPMRPAMIAMTNLFQAAGLEKEAPRPLADRLRPKQARRGRGPGPPRRPRRHADAHAAAAAACRA